MVKKGWGRIVFISSASGLQTSPEIIHYGVTKSAQIALSRGLAESVAGSGVTVNAVLPGLTRTEGVEKAFRDAAVTTGLSQKELEKQYFARPAESILGRMTTTEEVANLVLYICSRGASATTGAALRVDGGVVRGVL
jgi:NAD(P)-dependent dehydrogenase (short-subunit alcohol dehydrogenase family)